MTVSDTHADTIRQIRHALRGAMVGEWGQQAALDALEALVAEIERLPGYTVSAPAYERTAATTSTVWDAVAIARAALSAGSGGREPRPEGHEGMVTVYDHKGGYLGCMGRETWEKAVADEAQRRKPTP